MKSLIKKIANYIILYTVIVVCYSQNPAKDTVNISNQHSLIIENTDSIIVVKKSPLGAVLRSSLLPGWGQFYTESYWKIPVYWATLGYLISRWINFNEKFISTNDPRYRNVYKDNRDQYTIWIVITYLLNIADAYVGAHLFDFSTTENLNTKQFNLNLRINLR